MTAEVGTRHAGAPIDPMFLRRWSPRAFTGEPMPEETLTTLFEAARWAPSSFNTQPTRFIYARRDTEAWPRLLGLLVAFNQTWAHAASALVFVASDRFRRPPDKAPTPNYSHSFDAGAAWMSLALQAEALGWAAHGMTGFDVERAYEELGVPESDYRIEAAVAIGRAGDKGALPETLQAREQPNDREPLARMIFEGRMSA